MSQTVFSPLPRLLLAAMVYLILVMTHSLVAQTPATSAATTQSVAVPATIEAYWSADLFAKTSGYVADVKADIGDHVTKGKVLALLSAPELEKNVLAAKATLAARKQMARAADAAVAQARQALAVAQQQMASYQAEANFQQTTLKRQEELSAGNAATPQQVDEARSRAAVAKAGLGIGQAKVSAAEADILAAEANHDVANAQATVADAQLQEAEVMLDYTKLTAPFDGVITRRQVSPGDLVQAATTSRATQLFTIQKIDTVRVYCDVPELKAAALTVGSTASVKVYGLDGQVISGKVKRIATSLNSATRTMRAEIELENLNEVLRPGMYAEVTLTLGPVAKVAEATPRP